MKVILISLEVLPVSVIAGLRTIETQMYATVLKDDGTEFVIGHGLRGEQIPELIQLAYKTLEELEIDLTDWPTLLRDAAKESGIDLDSYELPKTNADGEQDTERSPPSE